MSLKAPIAYFVYKRLDHTRQSLESLLKCEGSDQSELFIFSDGPRLPEEEKHVQEIRKYIRTIEGFKNKHIIEQDQNLGLAQSIISGVTDIVDEYDRVIVLEDDMIVSPYFLRFMNDALELYNDNDLVASIQAYMYPVKEELPDIFFLQASDCWGWATWKRGWCLFEPDGEKLLQELKTKKLERGFDFNFTYDYTRMLENQIAGINDSWAIRWYASVYLNQKLGLFPGHSLIRNIGFDGSGKHSGTTDCFATLESNQPIPVQHIPVREDSFARQQIEKYFMSTKPGLAACFTTYVKRIFDSFRLKK